MRWLWVVVASLTVLAGCASSRPAANEAASTLQVHIGIFGGPARPGGGMAVSNAPRAGATVTVTDRTGHQWHARTGSDGIATFSLQPGRYSVDAPCDFTAHTVNVRAGRLARLQVHCDVP